jgi:NADPH:quinone reductase-like Zn-dependent oxidoreductase
MMKAVVMESYGPIDGMKLMQIPKPELLPNDVLIEVHAASVNPVDIAIRNGWLQERIQHEFPLVLGWDVAGVITAVGSDVTNFKVGDEVYSSPSLSRNGSYAEYIAVNESLVTLKPINTDFLEAVAIPLVGITAYRALVEIAKVKERERVLILGGAGGVGSFAIQLAKSYGAYVVASTSTKNLDFVRELGADEVIDYTEIDISDYNGKFEVLFDTVGRKSFEQGLPLVVNGGKAISIATLFNQSDKDFAAEHQITLDFFFSDPCGHILAKITRLVEQGKIKSVVGTVFPLEKASNAHELIETKHARGKIILQIK